MSRGHRLDHWSAETWSASNDTMVLNAIQHFLIEAIAPRASELAHATFSPH
ncbi:hypothetical protein ACRAKI_20760 [Saccharothrix isguenensis]